MSSNRPAVPRSQSPFVSSPAVSAVRPSPLSTGTLLSYPVTASSFTSSPVLSSAPRESAASPDYFDDFQYSSDMEDDFRRIDREVADQLGEQADQVAWFAPASEDARQSKTWVVFKGKVPGLYNGSLFAALQTQCYPNGFQRCFPSYDAAEVAWDAYVRDGTYPDYGRAPWVVFLGRKPSIFTKVTELEACVRGFDGAVFQSCSSVTEGKIKFQLFAEQVAQMFADTNLFSGVGALIPKPTEEAPKVPPTTQLPAPIQVTPVRNPSPLPPQVAESSKAASKRRAVDPLLAPTSQTPLVPRPGEGWYVVHAGAVPGVYYGAHALKTARPQPGGFTCAASQQEADMLFLNLAINQELIFVREE